MTIDKKSTKILARTFFTQLRDSGYTQNQVLDIASELLSLVAIEAQEGSAPKAARPRASSPLASL